MVYSIGGILKSPPETKYRPAFASIPIDADMTNIVVLMFIVLPLSLNHFMLLKKFANADFTSAKLVEFDIALNAILA